MIRSVIVIGLIVGFAVLPQAVQGEPPTSGEEKVQAEVYAALEKCTEKTVLVEVTLRPVEGDPREPDTWALVSERQDEVLARMESGDFEVMYRPEQFPVMMVGHAKGTGLARLSTDPDVVGVRLGKITSDVHTRLEKSNDGRTFVCVILKAGEREKAAPARRRLQIKKVQNKVLAKMKADEFKLVWRFETAAMLAGHIDAAGLAKLATTPIVVMVRPSKVEPETYTALEKSDEGVTYAGIILKHVRGPLPLKELKSRVKEVQDRVLSVFEPAEFKIISQFSNIITVLDGYINAAGLAKLEAHPDVMRIGGSKSSKVKVGLLESVPFIFADDVHDELGYTGAGITARFWTRASASATPMLKVPSHRAVAISSAGSAAGQARGLRMAMAMERPSPRSSPRRSAWLLARTFSRSRLLMTMV